MKYEDIMVSVVLMIKLKLKESKYPPIGLARKWWR